MAFKGTSALVVACVLFRAATCARRSRDPQLEQQFSNWFQDDGWHEHYEVARGRGAMWRQWTTEMDPLAVCNDGSPGAFYVRRGQGQGLNRWIIRFQGSQYCWDADSCTARQEAGHSSFLTTSNYAPEWISNMLPQDEHVYPWMLKANGILNVDPILNPVWHDWNHVYLFPCSSDAFLGDAAARAAIAVDKDHLAGSPDLLKTLVDDCLAWPHEDKLVASALAVWPRSNTYVLSAAEAMPWHFRGRRYLFAAFRMLLDQFQLTEASDVLLVGDSTGGAGMIQVVDELQELVSGQAPGLQRFKAWVDGGWMFPADQLDGGEFFFSPNHLALLHQNANATFGRRCSEHHPDEPWLCFYAPNAWLHLQTPVLFHHCLYDFHLRLYLLGYNTSTSEDPEEWEKIRANYITSYRLHEQQTAAMSRNERMTLQTSQPKARLPTMFSPACTWHQMSDADYLTASSQVGQLLFLEVFKDWFLGFEEEVFIVDSHPGVRPQEPPKNEAQWNSRGLQYWQSAEDRRALGLPADISETEPDFLMEPLLNEQPQAAATADISMNLVQEQIATDGGASAWDTSVPGLREELLQDDEASAGHISISKEDHEVKDASNDNMSLPVSLKDSDPPADTSAQRHRRHVKL